MEASPEPYKHLVLKIWSEKIYGKIETLCLKFMRNKERREQKKGKEDKGRKDRVRKEKKGGRQEEQGLNREGLL